MTMNTVEAGVTQETVMSRQPISFMLRLNDGATDCVMARSPPVRLVGDALRGGRRADHLAPRPA